MIISDSFISITVAGAVPDLFKLKIKSAKITGFPIIPITQDLKTGATIPQAFWNNN